MTPLPFYLLKWLLPGRKGWILFLFAPLFPILLSGQTIPEKTRLADRYPIEDGHLRIAPYHSLFFMMGLSEVRTDTIRLYNAWDSSMQLQFKRVPPFLAVRAVPELLPPHAEGTIVVRYDAAARKDYDMVVDYLDLYTNDTLNPVKKLEIMAVIGDDFDGMTLRERRNAPLGRLSAEKWDFGTAEQGSIVRYQLQVFNDGKDTLAIRKIKSSCGCTTGEPDRSLIAPGESATIAISFNTYGREGYHAKSVTIFTNDPDHPRLEFTIGGNIRKI